MATIGPGVRLYARRLLDKYKSYEARGALDEFVDHTFWLSGHSGLLPSDPANPNRDLGKRVLLALDLLSALSKGLFLPGFLPFAFGKGEKSTAIVAKEGEGFTTPSGEPVPDHYKTLGINENATKDEIKKAYRELALKKHPDFLEGELRKQGLSSEEIKVRLEGAIREIQDLNIAYDVLTDEAKKSAYDKSRIAPKLPQGVTSKGVAETPVLIETVPGTRGVIKTPRVVSDKVQVFAKSAIRKKLGSEVIKVGAKKVAGKIAAQAAIQAAATSVPLIGNIVAFVATEVVPKVFGFIKRQISHFIPKAIRKSETASAAAALGLIGAGLLLANPLLLLAGLGAAFRAGPRGFAKLFTVANALIAALIAAFVGFSLTMIAVTFAMVIFLTALIVFIIYTGSYVVPFNPDQTIPYQGAVTNPYIGLTKVADPSDVNNPPPNRRIRYTITITAQLGALTNLTFTNTCNVVGDGAGETCPGPQPAIPTPPNIISPGQPFEFSYEVEYTSRFSDSIVTDAFTVTANAPGATGESTTTSASVIIGNPPTDCFVVSDNAQPWPANYRSNLYAAITRLVTQYPTFVARVCAGGQVPLCYNPPLVTGDIWAMHIHTPSCDIVFNSLGVRNTRNATYLLTHEASHHIQDINPALQLTYTEYPGVARERPLCTYVYSSNPFEAFAEANALYVQLPTDWNSDCGSGNTFQGLYPIHYQFADQFVF